MSFSILIVDDEDSARVNIGHLLQRRGFEVIGAANLKSAREIIKRGAADIILLDVHLPDGFGTDIIPEAQRAINRPPVIVMTGFGDIDTAVRSMKAGAIDFLQKPIKMEQLESPIARATELVTLRRELEHLRQSQHTGFDYIEGKNPEMKDVFRQVRRAAEHCVSVLITGETGTGKEVIARAIHKQGPRANKPFVPINCAAIQPTVLETELFGYEQGAFTSADRRKLGLLETADGGVLFLDEISSMSLDVQAKLLRAIDDQTFYHVGGLKLIKVDIQFIAASNRRLKSMIAEGTFREDLYYRLKVIDLDLPPLRERKEDIPELVGFFMRKVNARRGLNIRDISPQAMTALTDYNFPGNLRELNLYIERAMIYCDEPVLQLYHFSEEIVNLNRDAV